jgi:hypothetical protein
MNEFMSLAKAFFEAAFSLQKTTEDNKPRTYAALVGDGLMPETMPPLGPNEPRITLPKERVAPSN